VYEDGEALRMGPLAAYAGVLVGRCLLHRFEAAPAVCGVLLDPCHRFVHMKRWAG